MRHEIGKNAGIVWQNMRDEVNEVEYKDLENMDSFIARLKEILQSPKISTLLSNLI